jgi:predicted polyphosphate/ATP-dependent NAD kinase
MHAIGLIANPSSGKDIRRLIGYGTSSDNSEKVNLIRRVLMGIWNAGIRKVYYMPDYFNIVATAVDGMFHEHKEFLSTMEITSLEMPMTGTEEDSVEAAKKFNELGVKCVITLGGDGTCRAVAKQIGDIPMIPVSTGTNNVFPERLEGTIVGMAAGAYATGILDNIEDLVVPSKRLDIYKNGEFYDIALIDAVVVNDMHTASKAIWKTGSMSQIFLTTCNAHYLGISSIGGQLEQISKAEAKGLAITIDPEKRTFQAPIIPGLFVPIGIKDYSTMNIGESISIAQVPSVIAVDGERNVEIFKGESADIKLSWNGPRVLNIERVLQEARIKRIFYL